jgi:hypothetical protein
LLYRLAPAARGPGTAQPTEEEARDAAREEQLLRGEPSPAFCALPPPLVCAHGGDVAAAPPNTAAAFAAALAGGARCVEVDVSRTLDGQLVVLHSRELGRLLELAGGGAPRGRTAPGAQPQVQGWLAGPPPRFPPAALATIMHSLRPRLAVGLQDWSPACLPPRCCTRAQRRRCSQRRSPPPSLPTDTFHTPGWRFHLGPAAAAALGGRRGRGARRGRAAPGALLPAGWAATLAAAAPVLRAWPGAAGGLVALCCGLGWLGGWAAAEAGRLGSRACQAGGWPGAPVPAADAQPRNALRQVADQVEQVTLDVKTHSQVGRCGAAAVAARAARGTARASCGLGSVSL